MCSLLKPFAQELVFKKKRALCVVIPTIIAAGVCTDRAELNSDYLHSTVVHQHNKTLPGSTESQLCPAKRGTLSSGVEVLALGSNLPVWKSNNKALQDTDHKLDELVKPPESRNSHVRTLANFQY